MVSVSVLQKYRRVPFKTQATLRPILVTPYQNNIHFQIPVRQAHTKPPSSFLSRARFKIGDWRRFLIYFMISLPLASELIDWILVHPLKSVYAKNFTYKSKDSSASYRHGILHQGYIRLVSIKAGNRDDPIELELNHVKFHPVELYADFSPLYPNMPTYEALSYRWGDGKNKVYVYFLFVICISLLCIHLLGVGIVLGKC